jgi:hypothetical protein
MLVRKPIFNFLLLLEKLFEEMEFQNNILLSYKFYESIIDKKISSKYCIKFAILKMCFKMNFKILFYEVFFLIIKGYFRNPKLYIMHYASKVLLLKFIRFYGKSFILKTCSWLYCFDTLILEKFTNLVESIWSQNTKVIKQIRRQIEKLQNKKKG